MDIEKRESGTKRGSMQYYSARTISLKVQRATCLQIGLVQRQSHIITGQQFNPAVSSLSGCVHRKVKTQHGVTRQPGRLKKNIKMR